MATTMRSTPTPFQSDDSATTIAIRHTPDARAHEGYQGLATLTKAVLDEAARQIDRRKQALQEAA